MHLHSKSFALRAIALTATLAFAPFASAALVTVGNCGTTAAACSTTLAATTAAAYANPNYPNVTGASGYTTYATGQVTIQGSPIMPTASGPINTLTGLAVSSQGQSNVPVGVGVTATFTGSATVANTSIPNVTAAPVTNLSGGTAPIYLTTNSGVTTATNPTVNSYTLNFTTVQSYLGLLWGSIGIGDLLTFYNAGGAVVAQITGQDAINAATGFNGSSGARGPGGSQYTLVNFLNGANFKSVTFSETISAAFESANVQYANINVAAIPEPGSIVLLGIGLAGLAAARRRKVNAR